MPTIPTPTYSESSSNRKYWGMAKELALTDFKLKYQGSVFGYLWSLMKPLAMFGILDLVFTHFIRIPSVLPHGSIYLLLGIVLWNYFAESTTGAMRSIVDKGDLIRKVYFPRIIILIANSLSALITLLLNLVVVAIFMAISQVSVSFISLTFVLIIIELYMLALGTSLFLAALYVRFRDFAYIWEVALQLLFYVSAILYELNIIGNTKITSLLLLSPVTQILQDARYFLITDQTITTFNYLTGYIRIIPYLIPILLVVAGYAYFNKWASRFAEDI